MTTLMIVVYVVGAVVFAAGRFVAGSDGFPKVVTNSVMWTGIAGLAGHAIGVAAGDAEVTAWSLGLVVVAAILTIVMLLEAYR